MTDGEGTLRMKHGPGEIDCAARGGGATARSTVNVVVTDFNWPHHPNDLRGTDVQFTERNPQTRNSQTSTLHDETGGGVGIPRVGLSRVGQFHRSMRDADHAKWNAVRGV